MITLSLRLLPFSLALIFLELSDNLKYIKQLCIIGKRLEDGYMENEYLKIVDVLNRFHETLKNYTNSIQLLKEHEEKYKQLYKKNVE